MAELGFVPKPMLFQSPCSFHCALLLSSGNRKSLVSGEITSHLRNESQQPTQSGGHCPEYTLCPAQFVLVAAASGFLCIFITWRNVAREKARLVLKVHTINIYLPPRPPPPHTYIHTPEESSQGLYRIIPSITVTGLITSHSQIYTCYKSIDAWYKCWLSIPRLSIFQHGISSQVGSKRVSPAFC